MIEDNISNIPGVESASIDLDRGVLTLVDDGVLSLDSIESITQSIEPDTHVRAMDNDCCGHESGHDHDHDHGHDHGNEGRLEMWWIIAAVTAFALTLIFGGAIKNALGENGLRAIYAAVYVAAAYPVLKSSARTLFTRNFLNEFFLMSIASLSAIALDKFPEAISVMLFYRIGEFLQEAAASRSRKSIRSLLDQKPAIARIIRDNSEIDLKPEDVKRGDIVIVRPGEKIPIDGFVRDGSSRVDTSSITGESKPVSASSGAKVYGGSVNVDGLLTIEASGDYKDSSISKIMEMVENAVARKSPTERFITSFARRYTPSIVALAVLIAFLPPILGMGTFSDWLYRALVLMVISCPCALVISIPLGYFGGIGAASRRGILVKGGSVFDAMQRVNKIFFDKTGTLTKGVFAITEVNPASGTTREELGSCAAAAEIVSNHPVARSIKAEFQPPEHDVNSIRGREGIGGVTASFTEADGKKVTAIAGNEAFMRSQGISEAEIRDSMGTVVHVARNGKYLGSIVVSDVIRPESAEAIRQIRSNGINDIYMLTGDRDKVAGNVARDLALSGYRAELLPEDKVSALSELSPEPERMAFVGDGVNDAPVLAAAGVGIAMGGLGAEAAVEIADAVILDDSPTRVSDLIRITKFTHKVVRQNIASAMGIKILFIVLGIFGVAGLWEAIFADVGVALLAVLNAGRTIKA
jgi:Cd2+/Zn2+-exporting ATPase